MIRTLLTQAEAAFLLAPRAATGADCIRAAMLALISQGRIAIAETAGHYPRFEMILGSDNGPDGLALHQRVVETALRSHRDGRRLGANEVLVALVARFGSSFGRYVHDHVAPPLIASGHVLRTDSKWLGFIPRVRYDLTPRGHSVVEPLRQRLASLDDLPAMIEADPDRALLLAHEAGVTLVLSPIARRHLPRLRKLMAQRDGGGGTGDGGTIAIGAPAEVSGFESAAWPIDTAECALIDGISAVCDATSGDSSSSDSSDGGDGGGGDGGGGDGGGGGD